MNPTLNTAVAKSLAVGGLTQAIESQVGELLAEYAAGSVPTNPQKEYGHRNGELLITAGARTLTASDSVA